MMVNKYIVCTYATYDVFIYVNKQSFNKIRQEPYWSLTLYIKHRLNMNRLKTRSLPAPCPVKWHFYRLATFVSDEIFLKYYNSRKTQVGSGGGGIWQRLQPLFRPVLLEVTVNYYHGLEYLHSSLHFFQKSSGRTNATLKKSINEEKLTNKPKILTSSLWDF